MTAARGFRGIFPQIPVLHPMRRRADNRGKRFCLPLLLAAVCVLLLSSCGNGFNPVGSWSLKEDDAVTINLEKGGRVICYDSDYDEVYLGTWAQRNGTISLTLTDGGSPQTINLTPEGNDTLNYDEGALIRAETITLPAFGVGNLSDYTWVGEEGNLELEFYSFSNTWDLTDLEDWETMSEGDFAIDGDTLIMTDTGGNKITAAFSEDLQTLTTSENEVYHVEE